MEHRDDLVNRRAQARLLLLFGFAPLPLGILFWVLAPGDMGPAPQPWYENPVLLAGVAGVLIGDLLMVRIYRAQPEPGERTWRYRDF